MRHLAYGYLHYHDQAQHISKLNQNRSLFSPFSRPLVDEPLVCAFPVRIIVSTFMVEDLDDTILGHDQVVGWVGPDGVLNLHFDYPFIVLLVH